MRVRVYLPSGKMADTPFQIQGDGIVADNSAGHFDQSEHMMYRSL